MARRFFRYEGTNWEGRPFYVSEPIRQIGIAVAEALPVAHGKDGTVASEAHDKASPNSDHRPARLLKRGIVRAIDIGITDKPTGDLLAGVLRLVPSVSYVLWQTSDHFDHIHVSTLSKYDNDTEVIHVFTQTEVQQLKRFVSEVQGVNSNMGFVRQCVEDIREKNNAGGHYAPDDHTHEGDGGGLDYGNVVKLTRP